MHTAFFSFFVNRLIEAAGGLRFVKGMAGDDLETWRRLSEGLRACHEDMKSSEARLAEDVCSVERRNATTNDEIAAEKV